jgi:hypothetical protein
MSGISVCMGGISPHSSSHGLNRGFSGRVATVTAADGTILRHLGSYCKKAWLLLGAFDSAAQHIMASMSASKPAAAAQLPLTGE